MHNTASGTAHGRHEGRQAVRGEGVPAQVGLQQGLQVLGVGGPGHGAQGGSGEDDQVHADRVRAVRRQVRQEQDCQSGEAESKQRQAREAPLVE